jgi:prolyl 4-hydroxylase
MKLFVSIAVVLTATVVHPFASADADFGLDCSWPVHSTDFKCGNLLGDRQAVYDHYMDGCREKWGDQGAKRCDANEADRIEMTRRQPQSMVNYTSTGFKKIKAPQPVWDLLRNYWEKNKDDQQLESWGKGNIYTNNWESPTYMVSIENSGLRGGGQKFKNDIWNAGKLLFSRRRQLRSL